MNKLKHDKMKKLLLLFVIGVFVLGACKKEKKTPKDVKDTTNVVTDTTVKTFYLVPSPEDIFGFADDPYLKFIPDLLNPVDNLSKYDNSKLQELNFGVYSADLAYAAANAKNDETKQYLKVVQDLSQQIGLAEVFNESLVNRIEHVAPQKDSLIALSNDTYFDIIRYLDKYQRNSTLAIMAAGGWLESMYLVVNQVDFDKDTNTVQKLANQKLVISNLMKFLSQNINQPNVKEIYDLLQPIANVYDQMKFVKSYNQEPNTDNEVFIIGGNKKISINKNQFLHIKQLINEVRNKITLNDVTK